MVNLIVLLGCLSILISSCAGLSGGPTMLIQNKTDNLSDEQPVQMIKTISPSQELE